MAADVQSGDALAGPLYIEANANPRSGSCTGQLRLHMGASALKGLEVTSSTNDSFSMRMPGLGQLSARREPRGH